MSVQRLETKDMPHRQNVSTRARTGRQSLPTFGDSSVSPATSTPAVARVSVVTLALTVIAVLMSTLLVTQSANAASAGATNADGRNPGVTVMDHGTSISFDGDFTDVQMLQLINAWSLFADTVGPNRVACMDDLRVTADEGAKWRAFYRISEREIVIKPSRFKPYAFIHELGHHLDLGCNAHTEIGPAFREAQGLGDQPWFQTRSWVQRPAEQFAETIGEIVWGYRDEDLGVTIHESTKALVTAWFDGTASVAIQQALNEPGCSQNGAVAAACQSVPYSGFNLIVDGGGTVVGVDVVNQQLR